MPEPEPVPEPAPPPPARECRRRRRSGSSASSRACRAQRRLHLGWAGDGEGAGPARERAGRARPRPRNPRPAGCPARGLEVEGRGSRPGATLPQPQHATAPPTEQGRSGGRDPAPCFELGEGARGRGPSALIGPQQGCPAHGLSWIPPRSASAGYCYNPGFPGATGMGRGSEHLAPPSIPGRNAPPLFLDTPPLTSPPPAPAPVFPSLHSRNLVRWMMELPSLCPGLEKGRGSRIPVFRVRLGHNFGFSICKLFFVGFQGA